MKSEWKIRAVLLLTLVTVCTCRPPSSITKKPYHFRLYIGHMANMTIAALHDGFYYKIIDEWCWTQVEFHGQVNMPFQPSDDSDDMLGEIMFHFRKTRDKPPCIWEKEVHGLTLVPDDLVHFYIYCCFPNGTDIKTTDTVLNVTYIRKYHELLIPPADEVPVYEQLFRTSTRPRIYITLFTTIRRPLYF